MVLVEFICIVINYSGRHFAFIGYGLIISSHIQSGYTANYFRVLSSLGVQCEQLDSYLLECLIRTVVCRTPIRRLHGFRRLYSLSLFVQV